MQLYKISDVPLTVGDGTHGGAISLAEEARFEFSSNGVLQTL